MEDIDKDTAKGDGKVTITRQTFPDVGHLTFDEHVNVSERGCKDSIS